MTGFPYWLYNRTVGDGRVYDEAWDKAAEKWGRE